MKILIQTIAGDMHAAAVAAVLRGLNADVLFSVGTDVPSRQTLSFHIDGEQSEATMGRADGSVAIDDSVDLFWCRRVKLFRLPALHADDLDFADREFRLFLTGLWQAAAPRAIRLNPAHARESANTKVVQLIAASRCGFSVSPTLCSHDPDRITQFVEQHGIDNVIFKAFGPMTWEEEAGRCFATPTTLLSPEILEEPADLRICPGIYQRLIDKAKEVRVTVMQDRVHCVEIIAGPDASVDWRVNQHALGVRPFRLPEAVEEACRKIVAELGLLFGCIDLILGSDGNWYFLEVNEMGQFLWIERLCPEERYLESFVQFLFRLCGSGPAPSGIELGAVMKSAEYRDLMDGVLGSPRLPPKSCLSMTGSQRPDTPHSC